MKHHLRRHSAVLKGDVQTLGRYEVDSNVPKSVLLHRHVLHVLKLVVTYCVSVSRNVPMQRTVLSPRNCGDITLQ